jgi:hypothetical protein
MLTQSITQSSDCPRTRRARPSGQAFHPIGRRGIICLAPFVTRKDHGLRARSVSQMFDTKRSRPLSNVGHVWWNLRIFYCAHLLIICSQAHTLWNILMNDPTAFVFDAMCS